MRALASLALLLTLAAFARGEGLVLNFRDAELSAIVAAVAAATGQRFIHDTELRGRITIILEDEISADEALEVLNAALLTTGYATLPTGEGVWKIVPIEAAKGTAPWLHGPESSESARLVTTFVRLEAASPDEIARILGREIRAGIVLPYPRTNGLIIAATEDRLAQMLVLVRALDQATSSELRVFPLRYADAAALAGQLSIAFEPRDDTPDLPWKAVVDERTNSLVVSGSPARVSEIRDFIERVDVPSRSPSGFRVVRLMNAQAEAIAEHLLGLDFGSAPAGAVPGASAASRVDVVSDAPTNSLVIRAPPAAFGEIARLIGELDRIPHRVAVDVYVWDVETAKSLELGFDALIPILQPDELGDSVAFATIGDASRLLAPAATEPVIARFTRSPLVIPIVGEDGNVTTAIVPAGGAQLIAAQGEVMIRALTTPHLLATVGEEQSIFAGDQVPIPVSSNAAPTTDTAAGGTTAAADNPFVTSVDIQRQDVGVDLRVTPVAVSEDVVTLEFHLEITSVAEAATAVAEARSSATDQGPVLRKLNVDATIRLTDGAVVLAAAAPADVVRRGEVGVPYLKDIPILGWFFRSTRDNERRRRLVVAVQGRQIRSPEQERADSIVQRLAFENHFSRTDPLRALTSAPYAVLVATRATKAQADQAVVDLAGLRGIPAIVPWTGDGRERFDVYLLGFEEISELGSLTAELRARGFTTRLEVVGPPRS